MGGFVTSAPNQEERRNYLQFLQNPPPAADSRSTVPMVALSGALGSALQLYNSFILQKKQEKGTRRKAQTVHHARSHTAEQSSGRSCCRNKVLVDKEEGTLHELQHRESPQRSILLRGKNS